MTDYQGGRKACYFSKNKMSRFDKNDFLTALKRKDIWKNVYRFRYQNFITKEF